MFQVAKITKQKSKVLLTDFERWQKVCTHIRMYIFALKKINSLILV